MSTPGCLRQAYGLPPATARQPKGRRAGVGPRPAGRPTAKTLPYLGYLGKVAEKARVPGLASQARYAGKSNALLPYRKQSQR